MDDKEIAQNIELELDDRGQHQMPSHAFDEAMQELKAHPELVKAVNDDLHNAGYLQSVDLVDGEYNATAHTGDLVVRDERGKTWNINDQSRKSPHETRGREQFSGSWQDQVNECQDKGDEAAQQHDYASAARYYKEELEILRENNGSKHRQYEEFQKLADARTKMQPPDYEGAGSAFENAMKCYQDDSLSRPSIYDPGNPSVPVPRPQYDQEMADWRHEQDRLAVAAYDSYQRAHDRAGMARMRAAHKELSGRDAMPE